MTARMRIIISCCIVYFSVGITNGALGPLLPEVARRTGLELSQAGLVFSALFIGGVLSRTIAGIISDRWGALPVLLEGIIIQGAANVAMSMSVSAPALLVSAFFLGTATGAGLLGAVLLAAKLFPERSVTMVNVVNVFYGGGAFAGPALFSGSSLLVHSGIPVLWIAAILALSQLPVLFRADSRQASSAVHGSAGSGGAAIGLHPTGLLGGLSIMRLLPFWLFGFVLLFDVGVESTIGGWSAVYLRQSTAISIQAAALVVSGFYACFTIGRAVAAGAGSRIPSAFIVGIAVATTFAGTGIVVLSTGHVAWSVAGFLLAGLGIGPVYPTFTALVGRAFGERAGTAIGLTGSIGFFGGVAFPWLAGVLMARSGPAASMRLVLAVVLIISVLAYLSITASRSGRVTREALRK
ncbi:MAG TPA: MFS transporter [Spirochaetia bacterium]|nr:MFS transporter [Spirochaetia bacterium]